MKILLAGGGSGGHVTPLKAISDSLNQASQEQLQITVVTDRRFYTETTAVFADDQTVILKKIFSGKYRRYKSKHLFWHLTHLPTLLKNLRDILLLLVGVLQSAWYFLIHKPDVVFCKGGFVCVPIGLAARLFKVPLIIHDSDTRPGLTNRILARWAAKIATGMPASFYPYPKNRMVYTGIPVNTAYQPITQQQQAEYKESLQLQRELPLVLITGGGNGATTLNAHLAVAAPALLDAGFSLVHLVGKGKAGSVLRARSELTLAQQKNWLVEEFAPMLPRLLAADVVVCRTSASTLQECANAKKAVIGIASPHLADQKMNAEFFASKGAISALDETELASGRADLAEVIMRLKDNPQVAAEYAEALYSAFARPKAARTLAKLLLEHGASA